MAEEGIAEGNLDCPRWDRGATILAGIHAADPEDIMRPCRPCSGGTRYSWRMQN